MSRVCTSPWRIGDLQVGEGQVMIFVLRTDSSPITGSGKMGQRCRLAPSQRQEDFSVMSETLR